MWFAHRLDCNIDHLPYLFYFNARLIFICSDTHMCDNFIHVVTYFWACGANPASLGNSQPWKKYSIQQFSTIWKKMHIMVSFEYEGLHLVSLMELLWVVRLARHREQAFEHALYRIVVNIVSERSCIRRPKWEVKVTNTGTSSDLVITVLCSICRYFKCRLKCANKKINMSGVASTTVLTFTTPVKLQQTLKVCNGYGFICWL